VHYTDNGFPGNNTSAVLDVENSISFPQMQMSSQFHEFSIKNPCKNKRKKGFKKHFCPTIIKKNYNKNTRT